VPLGEWPRVTSPRPEAMQDELVALLEEAQERELSPEEFSERLGLIHARFLGDDLNSPENVKGRRAALKAYEQLLDDIEEHHQIELIAEALRIDP
jgi:hypothetical protein